MTCDPNGADGVNQFALVTYIPGPLGRFLDELRLELAPDCRPRAHVSVLPPRPLGTPWPDAVEALREAARRFPVFEIEAGRLALFSLTGVVYLGVTGGAAELQRLHDALARGVLAFEEPYPYHPHITVAQELEPGALREAQEQAGRRWETYTGPRRFRAGKLVFVQNTSKNHWVDLAEIPLGAHAAEPAPGACREERRERA